jgi:hypothetical protein
MSDNEGRAATWPPERFFWSVLDAPGLKRAGPLPPGLLPEFQEDLPIPVEDVHAVAAPVGDGRLIVCAARRSALAQVDPTLARLSPDRLPDAITAPCQCSQLNLLVDEFEPPAQRRTRRLRHLAGALVASTVVALCAAGLHRRAAHWETIASDARRACSRALAQVSPTSTPETISAEVARLRSIGGAAARLRRPTNAAPQLAALLNAWPGDAPSNPQSLAVTPAGVTVSVAIDGDAAPFLRSFKPPAAWKLDQPRLSTAGAITRVTLQMRPDSPETKP